MYLIKFINRSKVWIPLLSMVTDDVDVLSCQREMDSTPYQILLNAVPQDKLILLDYYCDYTEIWRDTEQYYGKPYIWCYLGNFGGNTFLAGDLNDVGF